MIKTLFISFALLILKEITAEVLENPFELAEIENAALQEKLGIGFLGFKDKCQKICKDFDLIKNRTNFPDGSWRIDYELENHIPIIILYNRSEHFLAVYHSQYNMTWILGGKHNFMGFFNLTADALLLMNVANHGAQIITDIGLKALEIQLNSMIFFARLNNIIFLHSVKVNWSLSFNINGFLRAHQTGQLNVFFENDLEVMARMMFKFGMLIKSIVSFDIGMIGFVEPLVLGLGDVGIEFLGVIENILIGSVGFTAEIMIQLFSGLSVAVRFAGLSIMQSIEFTLGIGNGILNRMGGMFLGVGATFKHIIKGDIVISGGGHLKITTGRNEQSWIAFYGNQTSDYSIIYNSTHNGVGFLNDRLHLVFIADGNKGLSAIFNLTTGIGLAFNKGGSIAMILNDTRQDVLNAFQDGMQLSESFALLAQILLSHAHFDLKSPNVFDFKGFWSTYIRDGDTGVYFEGKPELESTLFTNFGQLFELAKLDKSNEGAKLGFALVFHPIFGFNIVGGNIAELFDMVFFHLEGQFTTKLMFGVYQTLNTNIEAGARGFTHFIFSGFRNIFISIAKIPGNILKSIDFVFSLPKITTKFTLGWGLKNIGFHLGG